MSASTLQIDHSVHPETPRPPEALPSLADKADSLQRIGAAFDFGVVPIPGDWELFASWQAMFDASPLPHSPAYHTFRAWYGWPAVSRGTCGLSPLWALQDRREGRIDPCEHAV